MKSFGSKKNEPTSLKLGFFYRNFGFSCAVIDGFDVFCNRTEVLLSHLSYNVKSTLPNALLQTPLEGHVLAHKLSRRVGFTNFFIEDGCGKGLNTSKVNRTFITVQAHETRIKLTSISLIVCLTKERSRSWLYM